MDKLKKVFSPGSKKDDETLYGDPAVRRASATEGEPQSAPEPLYTTEGSDKKEHGILRQILNPSGDKYDDQRYGTTASTKAPEAEPGKLQTDPEAQKHDHTIARQILNPNNDKYDEQRFGETAATAGDRKNSVPTTQIPAVVGAETQLETDAGKKDHSILRQIINPHGEKYDQQGYGSTAHAVGEGDRAALLSDPVSNPDKSITRQILNPGQEKYDPVVHGSAQPTAGAAATSAALPSQGTPAARPEAQDAATPGSCLSVKSGIEGPFAHHTDSSDAGAGTTERVLPDRTTATGESNLGRDSALLAGGAGAAGAGAYAAHSGNDDSSLTGTHPSTATTNNTTTTSPQVLDDRSAIPSQPASSHIGHADSETITSAPHQVGPAGGAHINPVGAPEEVLTSGGSQIKRDGTVGAGVAGITGTGASTQINSAPQDVQDATYTDRSNPVGFGIHHTKGPHQTDIANILDPHVPGEFPAADGTDVHGLNNPPLGAVLAVDESTVQAGTTTSGTTAQTGTTASGITAQTGTTASGPATTGTTESDTTEPGSRNIIGTIASAVGLGGLVGAASSRDHSDQAVEPTQSTSTTTHSEGTSHPIQTTTNGLEAAPASVQGTEGPSTRDIAPETSDHHYGRDAAIVGGAAGVGAAGYGIHEASKDRDVAAPVSETVGQNPSQSVPVTNTTAPTTGAVGQVSSQSVPVTNTTAPTTGVVGQVPSQSSPVTTTTATTTTSNTTLPSEPSTAVAAEPAREDHHYGRDAAIAGGAGAAGYGVYDATQARNDTGPASKTIGPHESNIANIVDPRVQPEPEKMKQSTTVGPHSSDIANRADPRVTSDPAQAQEDNRTRDAAIIGGAGAAGAGAIAASHHDNTAAQQVPAATTATTANEPSTSTSEKLGHDHKDSKKLQKSHNNDSDDTNDKGEKKHGLLHKILHPGRKDKEEKEEKEGRRSVEHPPGSLNHPLVTAEDIDNRISTDEKGHNKLHKKSVEQPRIHESTTASAITGTQQSSHIGTDGPIGRDNQVSGQTDRTYGKQDGTVIEPHTGLPMNVGQYGSGAGGTDAAPQIAGYHETDPAIRNASIGTGQLASSKEPSQQPGEDGVAGPDWNAIKKANTPY